MAETSEIDKAAWASLIMALIGAEADGNQTRFAAKVGVTPRTVNRWLESAVAVKPESVTEVARALGRSPVELLIRVGYLSPDEAAARTGGEPLDPDMRRWLAILADPDVPDQQKEWMRQQMRLWAEQVERLRELDRRAAEDDDGRRRAAG